MNLKIVFVIVVILMSGYGCISVGRPFSSDDLSWIIKDQTTKDDVYDDLGDPFRLGVDSGKITWTYGYYKYHMFGSTHTKDLVIYFNKDTQRVLFQRFAEKTTAKGYLFIGHSESLFNVSKQYQLIGNTIYQKVVSPK